MLFVNKISKLCLLFSYGSSLPITFDQRVTGFVSDVVNGNQLSQVGEQNAMKCLSSLKKLYMENGDSENGPKCSYTFSKMRVPVIDEINSAVRISEKHCGDLLEHMVDYNKNSEQKSDVAKEFTLIHTFLKKCLPTKTQLKINAKK